MLGELTTSELLTESRRAARLLEEAMDDENLSASMSTYEWTQDMVAAHERLRGALTRYGSLAEEMRNRVDRHRAIVSAYFLAVDRLKSQPMGQLTEFLATNSAFFSSLARGEVREAHKWGLDLVRLSTTYSDLDDQATVDVSSIVEFVQDALGI